MKTIFLAIAVTILSSTALTFHTKAQCYLGINPEHMPEFTALTMVYAPGDTAFHSTTDSYTDSLLKNVSQTLVKQWLGIYYSRLNAAQNEKFNYDLTNAGAAEFILSSLASKQPIWYITRMSVVLK